jgi:hypothetical protein
MIPAIERVKLIFQCRPAERVHQELRFDAVGGRRNLFLQNQFVRGFLSGTQARPP